jgi:hypothetical protein
MNYCRLVTLVVALLTTGAHASESNVEIFEQFDNIRVVALIDIDDIDNSPKWNADVDPVPLSVDAAIKAIRDFIKQPGTIGAIREIEIRTIKKYPGHWHYLIKTVASDPGSHGYDVYVVLMDGKVIPAIIEPESFK